MFSVLKVGCIYLEEPQAKDDTAKSARHVSVVTTIVYNQAFIIYFYRFRS